MSVVRWNEPFELFEPVQDNVYLLARVSPDSSTVALEDHHEALPVRHDVVVFDDAMLRRWSTVSNYGSSASSR